MTFDGGQTLAFATPSLMYTDTDVSLALVINSPTPPVSGCLASGTNQNCINSANLTGPVYGIKDAGTLTITNTASGILSGPDFGITAVNAMVTNDHLVEATGANGRAIATTGFANITNNATGVIAATNTGGTAIDVGGDGTIFNAGTIAGGAGGAAIAFHGANNLLTLTTGSTITGDVVGAGGGAANKLVLTGDKTIFVRNNFLNFTSLDVQLTGGGVYWDHDATIGATQVTNGFLLLQKTLTSPVTVLSGGTLRVDQALVGNATINNGGRLQGTGTIAGDIEVMSGGRAQGGLGSVSETLTVTANAMGATGKITFQPGSVFQVSVNDANQSTKLTVAGTATLGGATVDVVQVETLSVGTKNYTSILHADAGGLGGANKFSDTVTFGGGTPAFVTPTLSYTNNDVQLALVVNSPTPPPTPTPTPTPNNADTHADTHAAAGAVCGRCAYVQSIAGGQCVERRADG